MRFLSNIDSIKQRTPKGWGNDWFLGSMLMFALVLGAIFFLSERMLWAKLNVELAQIRKLQQSVQQVNQRLMLERADLESPRRLEVEAQRLGFNPPTEEQVVPVDVR